MKVLCDCGCGQEGWHNQMTKVEVEQAVDQSLRTTGTIKTFWVLFGCRKDFERELGMKFVLQGLVNAWAPKRKTLLQRLNFPLTFCNWCTRIVVAKKVMQLQHEIHERNYGFEYAKTRATNSAVLFAAPRFLQGFLARRFVGRLKKATEKAALHHRRNGE